MKKFISLFLAIVIIASFAISMSADSRSSHLTLDCNHNNAQLSSYLTVSANHASATSSCNIEGHMVSCYVYVSNGTESDQDPGNWTPRESQNYIWAGASVSGIIFASSAHGAWCDTGDAYEYFTIDQ